MSEVLEEPMLAHGLVGQKSFTMKNSVKAFNILSDSLYMNKVLAVIRELSCNAADAQIEAGTTDIPFEIHLPDEVAPYFFIRDFGTGLGHEAVLNLYTTYFDSTKSDSADATGALGLGSKSPFAVVDDFTVVSYQDGLARTYFAYKNDEGFPCISFVSEDDASTESNGIKIQFAVRKDKFADFRNNLPVALYHFEPKPAILNVPTSIKKEDVLVAGKNWEMPVAAGAGQSGYYLGDKPIVVMAKISYPLDTQQLKHLLPEEDHYILDVCAVPIRIHVENRSVDHTPSREHLQYNKKTIATVRRHLLEIYTEIFSRVQEEFALCETPDDVKERCTYLTKITTANIRVDPWKSRKRVFEPGGFKIISKIFSHPVTVGSVNNVNLAAEYASADSNYRYNVKKTLTLSEPAFALFDPNKTSQVWSRIEVKTFDRFAEFDILTDEEADHKFSIRHTPEITREAIVNRNLEHLRAQVRGRKNHTKHTIKAELSFRNNKASAVDLTGKLTEIDPEYTRLKVELDQFFVDSVLVIDDYPKDLSAMCRAGYARMATRQHTDYIVFSNIPRSGGRFVDEEIQMFEATVREIGRQFGFKVVKASEIIPPEIVTRPEPRRSMDRQDYCAFNVISYNESHDKFSEVGADKMGEKFELPGFESDEVIFVRRRYNDIYIYGDEDTRGSNLAAIDKEAKVGETVHKELEELIRFLSVFAGKNLLDGKILVAIKTKSQYQKALTKSKWQSLTSVIQKTVKSMTEEQIKQMFFTLALSRRNGVYEFLGINEVRTSTVLKVKDIYSYREAAGNDTSALTGVFANWFANCETSSKKVESIVKQQEEVLGALEESDFKEFAKIASAFFTKNQDLRDDHHMFNFFSSSKDGSTYSVRALVNDCLSIQKILLHILVDKFVVHLSDFMLQCENLLKKYPMLRVYAAKFTQGESSFTSSNIYRSRDLFPTIVDYVNSIEGVKNV